MLVGFISNVATAVFGIVQNVANAAVTVLATGEATTNTIDQTLVDSLINLAKACMGLFTEFPINIILIGGLCGVAFGLIRKAKKTAK